MPVSRLQLFSCLVLAVSVALGEKKEEKPLEVDYVEFEKQLACPVCEVVAKGIHGWAERRKEEQLPEDKDLSAVRELVEAHADGVCREAIQNPLHSWTVDTTDGKKFKLRQKTLEEQGFKQTTNPDGTMSLSMSDTTIMTEEGLESSTIRQDKWAKALRSICRIVPQVKGMGTKLARILTARLWDDMSALEAEDEIKAAATHFGEAGTFSWYVCNEMSAICNKKNPVESDGTGAASKDDEKEDMGDEL